jgi:hypothetical protein
MFLQYDPDVNYLFPDAASNDTIQKIIAGDWKVFLYEDSSILVQRGIVKNLDSTVVVYKHKNSD